MLAAALAALERGDDAVAIASLVAAWTERRSPSLAELVELLDARQPAHPFAELIATKAETTRKRLAAAPLDPRLASTLLDLLARPRFLTDRALWELVLARVEACADPRLHGMREAARATLHARLSPAALRDQIVRRLDALAVPEVPAPTDEEARLEAAIARQLGGAKLRRGAEDEILREIYEDPIADGPRLVYADLLTERGDPRGELITLQFARRTGTVDEAQRARERWLLKRHMKDWLGGLAPAVSNTESYSATTFERGFVAIADIYLSAGKRLATTWAEPGWATVEELRGPHRHHILVHAPLRGLRRLTECSVEHLELIARRADRFAHVASLEMWAPATELHAHLAPCMALPALRSLTLLFLELPPVDELVALVEAPLLRSLEHLVLGGAAGRGDAVTHQALLAELANVRGTIPRLGVIPPWRTWPRPAAVELVRTGTGYRPA